MEPVESLKAFFGRKVFCYPAKRSSEHSKRDSTFDKNIRPYRKGKDVLLESLLLSQVTKAFIVNSNVSYASRVFNPKLLVEYLDKGNEYY